MATVRSPRILVKIDRITVRRGKGANATQEPVVVKMKASHAQFLDLNAIDGDDPLLMGTFVGTAGNGGFHYLRNLGGFRARSFTLVAKTAFQMANTVKNANGTDTVTNVPFRSIDIGFPSGVKVIEFYNWLRSLDVAITSQIGYIRTPNGRKVDFTRVDNSPAAPLPDVGEPT
jgi:hypothetical protein